MTPDFSPHWHRVAGRRPCLRAGLRLSRLTQRGQHWIVLADERGRGCRLNPAAYAVVGRFDGRCTVQQLWDAAQAHADAGAEAGTEPIGRPELVELVGQLQAAGLLDAEAGPAAAPPPAAEPAAPRDLLAWRMPLGDPSRAVAALQRALAPWLGPRSLALWALAVATLAATALVQAPALQAHAALWMQTPRYLWLALAVYVPIKLLHELAHGLALQACGLVAHQAGLTWMAGLPMPYVDASAAAALPRRRDRLLVSAAGIMAELGIAAVAMALWCLAPDGGLRDLAFVVLFTAGLSTLLFNANPLQRLDGYYLLCDALDLPNLATRSARWWRDALGRRFGLVEPGGAALALAPGERGWLVAYAPAALAWRLGIGFAIVFWLGSVSAWLGSAAAVWLLLQLGLRPLWAARRSLRRLALRRPARLAALGAAGLAVLGVLAFVPVPRTTLAPGVVWLPEDAQLRPASEGFVEAVHRRDGDRVERGELLLSLRNPALDAEWRERRAQREALEHRLFAALSLGAQAPGVQAQDAAEAEHLQRELARAQSALELVEARRAGLELRAGAAGRLALPRADALPGSHVARGQLLGHLLTAEPVRLRVALDESLAPRLRDGAGGAGGEGGAGGAGGAGAGDPIEVEVWLADEPGQGPRPARLLRDAVAAARQLPSAALGSGFGGPIATAPDDPEQLRPLTPVVLVDVELEGLAPQRLGARGWARLRHGHAPWLSQLAERLRQAVLQRFAAA